MSNDNKKTALPKLRFPEFQDAPDWLAKPLGKTSDVRDGTHDSPKFYSTGKPLITSKNLLPNGSLDLENTSLISEEDYEQIKKRSRVDVGDILFGMIGTIGNPVMIKTDGFAIKNVALIKQQVDLLNSYLVQFFRSEYIFNKLDKLNTGNTQKFIALGVLRNLEVLSPSIPEQQKIADTLSSLDDLLTAQSAKLEALKAYKRGLMQGLFPAEGETVPTLRFPEFQDAEEWEIDSLTGEGVAVFVNEKIPAQKLKSEIYVSTENLLPDYAGVVVASKFPASGSCTRFKRGDILVSNIRPYLKKVWLADIDGAASNDVIVIRAGKNVSTMFLSFLLKNDDFIAYIMEGAEGVKMPRGDKELIREYPLAFPEPAEQQKIANCLSSLDNRITAQSQKIEALKLHKKGLMQHLFPAAAEPTA